ncbi:SET domain-containing protein, partial [Leucogyrophana mollusca]
IGGYPVLTWESQVRAWREAEPTYLLAKDLPHSLQDHVNNMPLDFRQSDQARILFEALIDDASDNEPHAPKIEVWDNDIGLETTPPWEFVYTNEMWYSENVPPPDLKNLQSCGCIGRCDPKSKTCSCVNKQYSFLKPFAKEGLIPRTWDGSGFLYNRSGKLQLHGYPIFECNQFCGCDEDCPNRVVQNGRQCVISINNTKEKGWGVFAGPKKIPKGTYIGIYAGELLTEKEGDDRGVYYNKFGRTYLFYIDYFYLENEPAHFVVDAYHAGNFTRFLNHSCDPNCALEACYINEGNIRKPLLAIFTVCDVEPYEELCFSYFGEVGEDDEEVIPQKDAVYAECRCGSKNCRGRMF